MGKNPALYSDCEFYMHLRTHIKCRYTAHQHTWYCVLARICSICFASKKILLTFSFVVIADHHKLFSPKKSVMLPLFHTGNICVLVTQPPPPPPGACVNYTAHQLRQELVHSQHRWVTDDLERVQSFTHLQIHNLFYVSLCSACIWCIHPSAGVQLGVFSSLSMDDWFSLPILI